MRLLLIALLLVGCGVAPPTRLYDFPAVPDADLTPGSMCSRSDPDFDELRYLERIPHCKRNVSSATKRAVYASYGLGYNPDKAYTIDHLISLSMGGSNRASNLWPQHRSIHTARPEYYTFCRLRDGDLTQAAAIKIIMDIKLGFAPIDSVTQPPRCEDY